MAGTYGTGIYGGGTYGALSGTPLNTFTVAIGGSFPILAAPIDVPIGGAFPIGNPLLDVPIGCAFRVLADPVGDLSLGGAFPTNPPTGSGFARRGRGQRSA